MMTMRGTPSVQNKSTVIEDPVYDDEGIDDNSNEMTR